MGIDHSNPYIHSTTVLCDINTSANSNCTSPCLLVAVIKSFETSLHLTFIFSIIPYSVLKSSEKSAMTL